MSALARGTMSLAVMFSSAAATFPPPLPPLQPTAFPSFGVWVLDGNKADNTGECITSENATTSNNGRPIAA